jgi:hypothetical protein
MFFLHIIKTTEGEGMKKNSLKSLVSISIFVLILSSSWAGQPKVIVPEPKFDLGKVPFNCKISHEFWVKNEGTDTLRIKAISVA